MRLLPTLALAALLASPAAAQTTPTERAAAGTVLQRIEGLQAQLAPAQTAQRLATRSDASRDRLLQRVEQQWTGGMQALADWIGHHPEVGFHEVQAVDTLTKVLRSLGFHVDSGVAGLSTAFVATWHSPAGANGPVLGLIGEYDALRDTRGAFHGDQHNAQTPVAIAAAAALQQYMTEQKVPGVIKLFGTPAEEVGPPTKKTMLDSGVFTGTDILVRSHSSANGTSRGRAGFGVCCLNINEVKYVFTGKPSHQLQSWAGRNALEAAVTFYTAVDHLRSTLRPEASIQGVIPEGGVAPNVVPDRAVADFYIRYPDEVYLAHIDSMMANAARGAALATGTKAEIQRYGEYRDGITLGTLEELQYAYAKKLGAPQLVAEAQPPTGYEETGVVSRAVPGVGINVASSPAPYHTHEMEVAAFTPEAHRAFLLDAQIEAAVLYHFLTDAKFRAQVQEEQRTMAGLFADYQKGLRKAYEAETGVKAEQ